MYYFLRTGIFLSGVNYWHSYRCRSDFRFGLASLALPSLLNFPIPLIRRYRPFRMRLCYRPLLGPATSYVRRFALSPARFHLHMLASTAGAAPAPISLYLRAARASPFSHRGSKHITIFCVTSPHVKLVAPISSSPSPTERSLYDLNIRVIGYHLHEQVSIRSLEERRVSGRERRGNGEQELVKSQITMFRTTIFYDLP